MRHVTICFASFCVFAALSAQETGKPALLGFTASSAATELDLEKRFRAIPDPDRMRAAMQLLSARPHHVGSPYDKQNAEWILEQYKRWGWDAHIETFQVLFPTPKSRLLEMGAWRAKLEEPTLAIDPTSGQKDEQLPTYNAYSPDGDVTAPLIYVNYGLVDDYEQLARQGIDVKGAIVMATRGAASSPSWRRSTEPWDALFFPIRLTMDFEKTRFFPMDPCVRPKACSAAACSMRRSTRAIL